MNEILVYELIEQLSKTPEIANPMTPGCNPQIVAGAYNQLLQVQIDGYNRLISRIEKSEIEMFGGKLCLR